VIAGVLVSAHAFTIDRGSAGHARVEVDLRAGLPALSLIGLPGSSARGVRERVQAAILNSGYAFPRRRVTVNVTPATRGPGSELDLAVACCVLAAIGELDPSRLLRIGLCAELSLGGELRQCTAVTAVAQAAEHAGLAGIIVALPDLKALRLAGEGPALGRRTLRDVVTLLAGSQRGLETALTPGSSREHANPDPAPTR
jgi:magnesium chelatase family protein